MEDKEKSTPVKCSRPKASRGKPLSEVVEKFTCTNPECPCVGKEKTVSEI